eukprot:686756-Rhodomonas_salina.1
MAVLNETRYIPAGAEDAVETEAHCQQNLSGRRAAKLVSKQGQPDEDESRVRREVITEQRRLGARQSQVRSGEVRRGGVRRDGVRRGETKAKAGRARESERDSERKHTA